MSRIVREAVVEDAAPIAAVHVATWREAYRGIVPDSFLDGIPVENRTERWCSAIQAPPRGQITLVAAIDGKVAGFAAFGSAQRADAVPGVGELYAIYVAPDHWEQGVGGALHQTAIEGLSRQFERAELWVLQANHRARQFYEHRGWQWDGSIEPHAFGEVEVPVVCYTTRLAPTSKPVTRRQQTRGQPLG